MTTKNNNKLNIQIISLYTLSFIEGGALMTIEILSAKIIAPYFGNSIYVWAAVLATTLLGLALGYYIGGNLSSKNNPKKALFIFSISSALLCLTLPFSSPFILSNTLSLGLQLGTIIAALLLMFPIIFCFGTVSPLIIKLTAKNYENSGKSASITYTISTIGGVLFAIITGLYFITKFGIAITSSTIGITLLSATLICYIYNK